MNPRSCHSWCFSLNLSATPNTKSNRTLLPYYTKFRLVYISFASLQFITIYNTPNGARHTNADNQPRLNWHIWMHSLIYSAQMARSSLNMWRVWMSVCVMCGVCHSSSSTNKFRESRPRRMYEHIYRAEDMRIRGPTVCLYQYSAEGWMQYMMALKCARVLSSQSS